MVPTPLSRRSSTGRPHCSTPKVARRAVPGCGDEGWRRCPGRGDALARLRGCSTVTRCRQAIHQSAAGNEPGPDTTAPALRDDPARQSVSFAYSHPRFRHAAAQSDPASADGNPCAAQRNTGNQHPRSPQGLGRRERQRRHCGYRGNPRPDRAGFVLPSITCAAPEPLVAFSSRIRLRFTKATLAVKHAPPKGRFDGTSGCDAKRPGSRLRDRRRPMGCRACTRRGEERQPP